MASDFPNLGETGPPVIKFEPFSVVEQLINSTFDEMVRTLNVRRAKLLAELNDIKTEYLRKEKVRREHVDSLTKLKTRYESQENKSPPYDEHLSKVKSELGIYQVPTPVPLPDLTWNLKEFNAQCEKYIFTDVARIYKAIQARKSNLLTGKLNKSSCIRIIGKDTVYVADCWNGRIQVVTMTGNWNDIDEVGKGKLVWPHSLDILNKSLYVSDYGLNAVLKFQDKTYIDSSKEGVLNNPAGLKVFEKEVFVADSDNNRIAVLGLDLEFIREFGKMLKTPRDVSTNQNRVFVADNSEAYNVHIFSKNGDLLSSIISLGNKTDTLFLCFDKFNNILISNGSSNQLFIYTIEGQRIHSISCGYYDTSKNYQKYKPAGIEVMDDNRIINADFTMNQIVLY